MKIFCLLFDCETKMIGKKMSHQTVRVKKKTRTHLSLEFSLKKFFSSTINNERWNFKTGLKPD
jgi:hypothetical protein